MMRIRRWGMVCICGLWTLLELNVGHVGAGYAPFGDGVAMSKLRQIQFHKGQDTTYKRSSPIPQLRCAKGCEFEPDVVQCTNLKPHGNKWRCETDLPWHLKFDETTIMCEGFDSPTDTKVLQGSCGLEYSLARTKQGYCVRVEAISSSRYRHLMAIAEDEEMQGWTASWLIVISVVLYLVRHNWRSFNFSAVEGNTGNHCIGFQCLCGIVSSAIKPAKFSARHA